MKVDIIVSSADEKLLHRTGLAGTISKTAGPQLQIDCTDNVMLHGPLSVTDTYLSTGGDLPCKQVLHAVGPHWPPPWGPQRDKDNCMELLVKT